MYTDLLLWISAHNGFLLFTLPRISIQIKATPFAERKAFVSCYTREEKEGKKERDRPRVGIWNLQEQTSQGQMINLCNINYSRRDWDLQA